MSLDIRLRSKEYAEHECTCSNCGHNHTYEDYEYYYDANITHNLNTMASKAGIYYALWRPEEINCKFAKDIIPYLEKGLKYLKSAPDKYKKYDSPNGWGMYIHFVPFVKEVLNACKEYPDSIIEVSR